MSHPDGQIVIQVRPEPTPEELAAISAAVVALGSRAKGVYEVEQQDIGGGRERWAAAGRREVQRPFEREKSRS